MKTLVYNIFVSAIIIAFTSCTNKQQNKYNKSITKPIILENKSNLNEYANQEKQPYTYSLYTKKIIYPEKTIYVYKQGNYTADSLVFSNNSVQMNHEKLLFLNKRLIYFKEKKIEVKKYQYLDCSSNLFIIDSLGLILQHAQTHPYGTVLREYNPKIYRALSNKIIEDSLFFSFEFDLKHLK